MIQRIWVCKECGYNLKIWSEGDSCSYCKKPTHFQLYLSAEDVKKEIERQMKEAEKERTWINTTEPYILLTDSLQSILDLIKEET